jgi:hypothetical protein
MFSAVVSPSVRGSLLGVMGVLSLTLASCAVENRTELIVGGNARHELEVRADAEIRAGECSGMHRQELDMALQRVTAAFTEGNEYAGFKRVGAEYLVTRDSGVTVALDAGLGGEYHVFVYGFGPVELSAEDQAGNVYDQPSNRTHIADVINASPASLKLTSAKGDYLITVKGKGCALLAAFKRTY